MKKMPCLFQRIFDGPRSATLLREVTPGCEWALAGEGTASRKWDGTACLVKDGALYKRYDAKRGKTPPEGAIPCDEPDPVTGHWPHWVRVDANKPEDKWHVAAWNVYTGGTRLPKDGTYELVGPHFSGNPEGFISDQFVPHGILEIRLHADVTDWTFDGIRDYLSKNAIEGIVFAHPDGRMCKIRRADYGLEWGAKKGGAK